MLERAQKYRLNEMYLRHRFIITLKIILEDIIQIFSELILNEEAELSDVKCREQSFTLIK